MMPAQLKSRWIAGAMSSRTRRLRPIVCVDLGFAAKRKSTGIATLIGSGSPQSGGSFTFANAIKQVAGLLQAAQESVLIIEAPLSACFSDDGNPAPRKPFESQMRGTKRETRYWYTGAGASTMLSAIFFVRELEKQLAAMPHQGAVHLFEGFLSFKSKGSVHAQDAELLLQRFLTDEAFLKVEAGANGKILSSLGVIAGIEASATAPEVILVDGGVS